MSTGIEQEATLSDMVAEEIRARLARQRLSGRELARRLDVSASWVSYRLTGSQPIDLNDLERIAEALGVRVVDLLPAAVVRATTERYPTVAKRTMPRVPAPRRPPGRPDSRRPPRQPTPTRPRTLPRPALPVTAR